MSMFGKFSIRLLGFSGPVVVYFATPVVGANRFSVITITAALLMIYITLRMMILSSTEQLDIFMMCNYLFYYVSSGVAVIAMERQGIRLNLDWAFPLNNLFSSLLLSILSLWVIEYSYLKVMRSSKFENSNVNFAPTNKNLSVLSIISLFLSAIYFTLIPVRSLFDSRATAVASLNATFANDTGQASIGLLIALTKIAPLCICTFVILARKRRGEKYRILDYISVLPSLMAINPISSARYVFLILVITLGCSFFKIKSNFQSEMFVYVGVIVAILIFPNLDFARNENGSLSLLSISESFEQVANKDFDQISMGALTLQTVRSEIAPIGRQILGPLGFWIPRSVWNTKPYDTSILIARDTGLRNTNLSIPLWAEGWSSFRFIGVIGYPFLLGYFAARIKQQSKNSSGKLGMYFFLSGSVFILQRGPLLQATGIVVFGLLCFYLLSRYETSRIQAT
jgi:hypothetical protein